MKRRLILLVVFPLYILFELFTWICLALDHLFFPGFKKVNAGDPVFIIGMNRSATTLCLSALELDEQNFSSMKFWEIILAPSIIQKKVICFIYRLDKRMNRVLYRLVARIDRRMFRTMASHHPMSLLTSEEDIFLFFHTFHDITMAVMYPRKHGSDLFALFDALPDKQKRFKMKYYQGLIQRHLYYFGKEKRYLSKSPPNTPRIRTLINYFPQCRFIYMIRDPLKAITSSISVFNQFRKMVGLSDDTAAIKDVTLKMADCDYSYALLQCRDLHGSMLLIVSFNEITQKLIPTIRSVYKWLDIEYSHAFDLALHQSMEKLIGHKCPSHYSTGQFGLMPDEIRKRYDYVYQVLEELTSA